jgi:hypothetical protein
VRIVLASVAMTWTSLAQRLRRLASKRKERVPQDAIVILPSGLSARLFASFLNGNASPSSRKYQPLPTMPCSAGGSAVSIVLCAMQVTAENEGVGYYLA